MDNSMKGNKTSEEDILNCFEFLKSLFVFLKNGTRLVHKQEQLKNIKIIYTDNVDVKC